MTTQTLDPMSLTFNQVQPLSLAAYLQAVDAQLARLTCGLLARSDFDVCWTTDWRAGYLPQQAVAQALAADGFIVSCLPTPMMRQLAAQPEVRHGQT